MLETARLRLRPFTAADSAAYAALVDDEEAMRFIGGPVDAEDATRQLGAIVSRTATDGFGVLAAVQRTDGLLVGRIGFWIWDRRDWTTGRTRRELGDDAEVELGWLVARGAWRRGYATEAARELLRHGVDDLGFTRVISLIDPANAASLRVAERLGAEHERDIVSSRWGRMRLYRHDLSGYST